MFKKAKLSKEAIKALKRDSQNQEKKKKKKGNDDLFDVPGDQRNSYS